MPGLLIRKRLREGTLQENGEYLFKRKGVLPMCPHAGDVPEPV
jgi:hypothetical protein